QLPVAAAGYRLPERASDGFLQALAGYRGLAAHRNDIPRGTGAVHAAAGVLDPAARPASRCPGAESLASAEPAPGPAAAAGRGRRGATSLAAAATPGSAPTAGGAGCLLRRLGGTDLCRCGRQQPCCRADADAAQSEMPAQGAAAPSAAPADAPGGLA